jgi:GT2 family glycosyltransferase
MLAVVVLHRTSFAASRTLQGLAQAAVDDPAPFARCQVLVWDNSPEEQPQRSLPFDFTYHHANRNDGVAGAYNGAMRLARERGCEWLLLLDHDTSVTAEFLRGMAGYAERDTDPHIAAVVPFLYAGDRTVSPRLWRFGRHQSLPRPAQPYTEGRPMFAANSGTMLRVAALSAIGGYSSRFWLDYSDIYVFHRLHAAGYRVWIAAELRLQHEIAMLDYDNRMTPARYEIYLAAEGDFLDLYRGPAERALYLLRLAARVLRQRRYASPAFSKMSLAALWQRLRMRRAQRLARPLG